MKDLNLKAIKRDVLGKKARFLRRQGITPSHILGHNIESLSLQCNTAELERTISLGGMTRLINLQIEEEKQPRSVFIREIQRDALSGQLLHVDFYQIKRTEKITVDIPIILVGEAPAMKSKGRMIQQTLTHLGVECLPEKLPPQIEVDLSPLGEVDQAIHVRDLALDPEVTVTTDPDQLIVKVTEVAAVMAEEVAEKVEVAAEAKAVEKAEAPTKEQPKE